MTAEYIAVQGAQQTSNLIIDAVGAPFPGRRLTRVNPFLKTQNIATE
ncbi:hypothetical protein [Frankia sp. CcI49]|nr:hypothetical protein [Frankia sp. CcI49]